MITAQFLLQACHVPSAFVPFSQCICASNIEPCFLCITQSWVGTVTELIPPNYGIIDGEAFFVNQIVMGTLPQVTEGTLAVMLHIRLERICISG